MKQRKKKGIKRNEDNLRDLWDNIKHPNIRIIGVPEEEDKKKGDEKMLEEIIVENFLEMRKEIATQVQETQSPKQDKPKVKHPKTHINHEGEIKSFTDKQKLREFSTTKPALQQMLKDLL